MPSGNLLWTGQFTTSDLDHPYSVALDGSSNAYISGYTRGSLDGTNAGSSDAFLVKFVIPEPCTISLLVLGGLAVMRRRKGKESNS